MRPRTPNEIRENDEIGAKFLNDLSARADLATSMVGINGIGVRVENGKIILSGEKGLSRQSEPGIFMSVVNVGTTDLEIYAVAGLGENFYKTRPNSLTGRVLEVQEPKAYNAGEFVITLQRIPQDHVGLAWFSGVCLARLVREFDGPLLNRADCLDGEQALRASINGPVRILWEETTDPEGGALDPEEEHLAVIHWDGRGDTYLDWHNAGGTSVYRGCPIVSYEAGTGSGISNDRLGMQRPDADGMFMAMINVGGTIAAGENGKMLTGAGPFMARLNDSILALRPCGTLASTTDTFVVDSIFWRAMAYLGTNVAGQHWAIIQRDTMSPLMVATADPVADEVTCETSTEDGGASGEELTLPIAFEP